VDKNNRINELKKYAIPAMEQNLERAREEEKAIRQRILDTAESLREAKVTLAKLEGNQHSCPRRMGELGPWDRKENLDWWNETGEDRTCSFCGSGHPEDVLAFLKQVDGEKFSAEMATGKNYKLYLSGKAKNAGEGMIKFYMQHLSVMPEEFRDAFSEALVKALHLGE
jgi:hypothetical protein